MARVARVNCGVRALRQPRGCHADDHRSRLFKGAERDAYDAIEGAVRLARYGTDCYAYAMLAADRSIS